MKIALEAENELILDPATRNDNVVYYICGYLVLKINRQKHSCDACRKTLCVSELSDLPEGFKASDFTRLKSKGYLTLPSHNVFKLLSRTEMFISDFCDTGEIFEPNAFVDILYAICVESLPKVGCQDHHSTIMSNLIHDYMVTRFKFIGKEKTRELTQQKLARKHAQSKQSKL